MKRLKPSELTPELFEEVKKLYAEGFGLQMIRRKLNLSEHRIRAALHNVGLLRSLEDARKLTKHRAAAQIKK